MFGQPPIGRQFAAKDRQRRWASSVEIEHVIARYRRQIAGAILPQRSHPGVAPYNVGRLRRRAKPAPDGAAQISDLAFRGLDHGGVAGERQLGRADQTEITLEWND